MDPSSLSMNNDLINSLLECVFHLHRSPSPLVSATVIAPIRQLFTIVFQNFVQLGPNQMESDVYIIAFSLLKGLISVFKEEDIDAQPHWTLGHDEDSRLLSLELLTMIVQ